MQHLTRVADGREPEVEHQLGLNMWEYHFPVIWRIFVLSRLRENREIAAYMM